METIFGKFTGGSIVTPDSEFKVMAWKRNYEALMNKTGFFLCEVREILYHPHPEYIIKDFVLVDSVDLAVLGELQNIGREA